MFGHDDHHGNDENNNNPQASQIAPAPDGALMHNDNSPAIDNAPDSSTVVASAPDTEAGSFIADDAVAAASDTSAAPEPPTPAVSQEDDNVITAAPSAPAPAPASAANDEDLLNIKQQALQELSPLVDHLEQTPEEEFRTKMMMIQASDNAALIKKAYDAAQKITDEKVRAQALLDIVNEINYFTQSGSPDAA